MEKISIVIPGYNCEDTIERCLDSILEEKIEAEILFINDGSTDNTKNIIKEYQKNNKNIKMISQENGGIASARNACIKHSKGDIILFIDSDVIIKKGCIKKLSDYIEDNDITYPTLKFEPGGIIHPKRPQEFKYPHISAIVMIKRSVFDKVGLFDEKFKSYAEDTDLFIRCVLKNISSTFVEDAIAIHLDRKYDTLKRYFLECRNIPYGIIKWWGIDKEKIRDKFYFCFTLKYIIVLFGLGCLNINAFAWEIYMKRQNNGFIFLKQIIQMNKKFTEKRDIKSFFMLMKLFFKGFFEGIKCGLKERKK